MKNHSLYKMSGILVLSILSTTLSAQAKEKVIVVTANRLETDIKNIGSSVTVIDKETLEKRGDRNLADALKRITGLSIVRRGGVGANTNIRMRGANAEAVRVMIDGINVADTSATDTRFDFESFPIDSIERIEIVRGNQSALYGSNAIGGVINIITNQNVRKGISGSAYIEGGSYGTVNTGSNLAMSNDSSKVFLNMRHGRSDGFSRTTADNEKDGYRQNNISGGAETEISKNLIVGFTAGHEHLDSEYDGFFTPFETYEKDFYYGKAFAKITTNDEKLVQTITAGGQKTNRDYSFGFYDGKREELGYKADIHLFTRDSLTLGSDYNHEQAKATGVKDDVDMHSFYGQYLWGITDDLTLTLGMRQDNHDKFGSYETYRTAIAYNIPETGTILRGSYGTGFVAPNLYQLYDPTYGYDQLEPEKSKGFDLGFEQEISDKIILSSTFFRNNIKNLFAGDPVTFVYYNIGKSTSYGFENNLEYFPTDLITLTLGHTYTLAQDDTTNLSLFNVPKHIVNFGADYKISPKWKIGGLAHYVSNQRDVSGQNDDYITVDAKTSYDLTDNVEAYIRAENIFDTDYQEVLTYRTAGVSGYGGLRVKF